MKITRREWLKGVPAFIEQRRHKDGTVEITKAFIEQLRDAVSGEPNEPWDDDISYVKARAIPGDSRITQVEEARAKHLAAELRKYR